MFYYVTYCYHTDDRFLYEHLAFTCEREMALFILEATARGCVIEDIETHYVTNAEQALRNITNKGVALATEGKKKKDTKKNKKDAA